MGGQSKAETRVHAERMGLPVANKPDSQEVCFVPGADHGAFLEQHAPQLVRPGGRVVDQEGRTLTEHDGTFRFTVGQRRGLGVSTGERNYVLEVDATGNRVVVGPAELLSRRGLVAEQVSWIAGRPPERWPFEAEVRTRYKGEDVPAVVEVSSAQDTARVEFRTPQRGIAPGQSVVFYRGDELLGGGRIREALHG